MDAIVYSIMELIIMKLFFITSNEGKFREVRELLKNLSDLEFERLEIDYPEVQAESLYEVADFAVKWLIEHNELSGKADHIMIEDSGLFIERLKGFPGVYSAFVHKTLGYQSILELMDGEWDRRAYFETCIGLISKDSEPKFFKGKCEGNIAKQSRGDSGFGYDPIFIPEGESRTFAEMSTAEKNQYSHRSKAVYALNSFFATLLKKEE